MPSLPTGTACLDTSTPPGIEINPYQATAKPVAYEAGTPDTKMNQKITGPEQADVTGCERILRDLLEEIADFWGKGLPTLFMVKALSEKERNPR